MSDEELAPRLRPPRWAVALALVLLVGLSGVYVAKSALEIDVPEGNGDAGVSPFVAAAPEDDGGNPPPHISMIAWRIRGGERMDGFQEASARPDHAGDSGGRMTGHVETGDEVSLPGARVSVVAPSEFSGVSAVTQVDGAFELNGLSRDGVYTVEVAHPDFGVEMLDGLRLDDSPVAVTLESFRHVTVDVIDEVERPLTDFQVGLWRGAVSAADVGKLAGLAFQSLSHSEGTFIVTDVTDDLVTVVVRAAGYPAVHEIVDISEGPQWITVQLFPEGGGIAPAG